MPVDIRYQEQARAFVAETMKQVLPTLNVDSGSAVNTVMALGAGTIGAVLHQEIDHLLNSRSISDPDAVSEDDMDLMLANLLVTRDDGDLAFGFVRFYYSSRIPRSYSRGTTTTTEDGSLSFVTLADLAYSAQDYFIDDSTGEFFLNIPFSSAEPGDDFNVDIGAVTRVKNDGTGALRVTNVSKFTNGKARQSNAEVLRTAQRAVSTRTPLSRDGVVYFLESLFGGKLRNLLAVGIGDPEMLRDEIYDMGPSADPRFQIGKQGLGGAAQNIHVGGRTDCYLLFDTINYVQQHVDLFADMITGAMPGSGLTTIVASIVTGTSGVVAADGKLIINVGKADEETLAYSLAVPDIGNVNYTFTLVGQTALAHPGTSNTVKVVNNGTLTVAPDGDITTLPVFKVSEIRLLDPLTFQPIGTALPETTPGSRDPGWYIADSNPFDILSARETKVIHIDEKRSVPGNAPLTGNGTLSPVVVSSVTYTQLVCGTVDFTGYQGRALTVNAATRTIIEVVNETTVILSGALIPGGPFTFTVAAGYGDYNQYPVRVSYYTNTEIEEAQNFLDSDSRRTICSDILARTYMPMFLDFVYQYRGDGTVSQVRSALGEILKTAAGEALGESASASFDFSDLVAAAYTDNLANYVKTPFEVRIRRLGVDGQTTTRYLNPSPSTYGELAVKTAAAVTTYAGGSWTATASLLNDAGAPFVPGDVGRRVYFHATAAADRVSAVITAYNSSSQVVVDHVFTASVLAGGTWSFSAHFLEAKLPAQVPAFAVPTRGKLYLGGFTSNQEVVEYLSFVASGSDYTFILAEGNDIVYAHPSNEPLHTAALDFDLDNVVSDGVITDERVYRPFFGTVVVEKLP
jgi:hypothetical protein